MLYDSCRELPIHNFNEIIVTSNLDYLVKEGEVDLNEKMDKWLDILDEWNGYFDETSKALRKKAKIIALQVEVTALASLLEVKDVIEKEAFEKGCAILKVNPNKAEAIITSKVNRLNYELNLIENEQSEKFNIEDILATLRVNGMNLNRFNDPVSELASCLLWLKRKANARDS